MKHIIKFFTLCIVLLVMLGVPVITRAQGIEFGHDLGEALKKAKAEKKLVFVDFYTSWCAPCKVMSAEVFPLANVGTYFNSNFVNCKVQCDDKGIGVELGKKYQINAYPTLMFLNGDGELVHSFVGGASGNGLIEAGKAALNPDKNLLSIMKQWDSGDRSAAFVANYFSRLKKVYLYEKYTADFNTYFNKLGTKEKAEKGTFDLIKLIGPAPFSPIFEYVEKNRDAYVKSIGADVVDKYISNAYLWHLKALVGNEPRTAFYEAMTKFKAKKYPYYDEFAMFYTPFEAFDSKGSVDINEYMKRGTAFLDKYGKNNDQYTVALTSLLGNCTGRPNAGEAGIKWMEDLLARNPDPSYMSTYFYITWRNFQFEKALEIGNKIRETAIKNKQSTAAADKNIAMINDLIVKYKDRAVKSSKTDK